MSTGLVIGRFQPLHIGHEHLLREAAKRSEHLNVFIGSSNLPRTPKNPFTFEERKMLIERFFKKEGIRNFNIAPLPDNPYDEAAWKRSVRQTLPADVVLYGYESDESSYYLKELGLDYVQVNKLIGKRVWHATEIRNRMFSTKHSELKNIEGSVSDDVHEFLRGFILDKVSYALHDEYKYYQKYKESFSSSPFPPIHVTADFMLKAGQNVLVVKRKNCPGKGLYALPGGFVDQHETLKHAAIRELEEETSIDFESISEEVGQILTMTYDYPGRSLRGRTITSLFFGDLGSYVEELPLVEAADDAAAVMWMPLSKVKPEEFFEDHAFIIKDAIKRFT